MVRLGRLLRWWAYPSPAAPTRQCASLGVKTTSSVCARGRPGRTRNDIAHQGIGAIKLTSCQNGMLGTRGGVRDAREMTLLTKKYD